ncbi:hypothetical protein M3J09_009572 [Ascochyta lentis]
MASTISIHHNICKLHQEPVRVAEVDPLKAQPQLFHLLLQSSEDTIFCSLVLFCTHAQDGFDAAGSAQFPEHDIICGADCRVRAALFPSVPLKGRIIFEATAEQFLSHAVSIRTVDFRRAVRIVGVDAVVERVLRVCCVCHDRFFVFVVGDELEDGVRVFGHDLSLVTAAAAKPQLDFVSGLWVLERDFLDVKVQACKSQQKQREEEAASITYPRCRKPAKLC